MRDPRPFIDQIDALEEKLDEENEKSNDPEAGRIVTGVGILFLRLMDAIRGELQEHNQHNLGN